MRQDASYFLAAGLAAGLAAALAAGGLPAPLASFASAGAAAPAAASAGAASTSSSMAVTDTSTGFSWPLATNFTPFGSVMSLTCSEVPFVRALKSTLMNSGMYAGKQTIVSSVITWLARQFSVLTAGDSSSPL